MYPSQVIESTPFEGNDQSCSNHGNRLFRCAWPINEKPEDRNFIDDFSNYATTYTIKSRGEVSNVFNDYIKKMEAQFPDLKIKLLRRDNARELIMRKVARICKDRGITIDSSNPYCPEQNSRAETFNRSLMEKSRAMILDSGFDKEEWPFVVKCAEFIINRSPSRTTKEMKTRYELFYGSRPNLKNFRMFGCVAWQHIDEQARRGQISKLDPRAIERSFIGYTSNGYIFMEPSSKKTYRSCGVKFIETRNFRELKEKQVQNTEETNLIRIILHVNSRISIHMKSIIPTHWHMWRAQSTEND